MKSALLRRSFFIFIGIFTFLASIDAKDYTIETIPNVRLSDRNNHVSNPDGIISSEDVMKINQVLQSLEDSLGIEAAVVAIDGIGDQDARSFATDLFNHWKLGKEKKDNGLLIQLVIEPTQRSVVFETGYGIEGVLPDAICYRLQQRYMIPYLKTGNYSEGMLNGVVAVSKYLMASDYERAGMTGNNNIGPDESLDSIFGMAAGIFILVIIIILISSYLKHRPKVCPRCGKKTLVYCGRNTIVAATHTREGLVEEVWRCKNCGYTEKHNRTIDKLQRAAGPVIFGGGVGGLGGGSWGGRGGGGFGGGSWGGGGSGGGGSISRF